MGRAAAQRPRGAWQAGDALHPQPRPLFFFDISAENSPTSPRRYVLEVPTPPSPPCSTARSGRFLVSTLRRLAGLWLGAGSCLFCTQHGPGLGPSRKRPPPCPEEAASWCSQLLICCSQSSPAQIPAPSCSDAPAQLCALPPALPAPWLEPTLPLSLWDAPIPRSWLQQDKSDPTAQLAQALQSQGEAGTKPQLCRAPRGPAGGRMHVSRLCGSIGAGRDASSHLTGSSFGRGGALGSVVWGVPGQGSLHRRVPPSVEEDVGVSGYHLALVHGGDCAVIEEPPA